MLTENGKTVFCMKLAGRIVRVTAGDPAVQRFCSDYLVEDTGSCDLAAEITEDDLLRERERAEAAMRAEHQTGWEQSDKDLEILAVYRKIAEQMPLFGTVLLHGSAVAVDGEAYLFTAKSGTGKSTHTALWTELFGSRAVIVNDDKPLIGVKDGQAAVYGTPWNGKHRRGSNIAVPLRAVCLLERSETNRITELTHEEAYPALLSHCYRPEDPDALLASLGVLDRMKTCVRFYRLGCNMTAEAAETAYRGMQRE